MGGLKNNMSVIDTNTSTQPEAVLGNVEKLSPEATIVYEYITNAQGDIVENFATLFEQATHLSLDKASFTADEQAKYLKHINNFKKLGIDPIADHILDHITAGDTTEKMTKQYAKLQTLLTGYEQSKNHINQLS